MNQSIFIAGTRPQFIKLLCNAKRGSKIFVVGQHSSKNMSIEVIGDLAKNLEIDLQEIKWHGHTAKSITEIYESLRSLKIPEETMITVFGDCATTLYAAIAIKKAGFKLRHYEAGLRSGESTPEEIIRITVDYWSDYLVAPYYWAKDNLVAEGIPWEKISVADYRYDNMTRNLSGTYKDRILKMDYVLVTSHRPDNMNIPGLENIVKVIRKQHPGKVIVWLRHHRQPKEIYDILERYPPNLIYPPLPYLKFLSLLKYAEIVYTDSGGVNREAYALGKPLRILRDVTEWKHTLEGDTELVGYGASKLKELIISEN